MGSRISSSNPLYETAVKYKAAYLSLLSYAEIARREVGDLPGYVESILRHYRELSDQFLEEAERVESTAVAISASIHPSASPTASWWDEET